MNALCLDGGVVKNVEASYNINSSACGTYNRRSRGVRRLLSVPFSGTHHACRRCIQVDTKPAHHAYPKHRQA